jgi:hypothetical protein
MADTPKTTAVDWLREKIQSNLSEPMSPKFAELFEEAREMHRDEMTTFGYAQIREIESELGDLIYKKVPEEIYNKTYGKSE